MISLLYLVSAVRYLPAIDIIYSRRVIGPGISSGILLNRVPKCGARIDGGICGLISKTDSVLASRYLIK